MTAAVKQSKPVPIGLNRLLLFDNLIRRKSRVALLQQPIRKKTAAPVEGAAVWERRD
jgi:hypothetical protein